MPNFDNIFWECLGFSQIIISTFLRVSTARKLMSSKFPIGVATMYSPAFIILLIYLFTFLISCSPVNNIPDDISEEIDEGYERKDNKEEKTKIQNASSSPITKPEHSFLDNNIQNNITIIFSDNDKNNIVEQFVNVIELALYKKNISNLTFELKKYSGKNELKKIIEESNNLGKIYIGPINSSDTSSIKEYCDQGAIFFSFSPEKNLAEKCIFLINFFPENELEAIFNHLPKKSKIALLYPENNYGYSINKLVDNEIEKSEAILVNRSSYKVDMSNVRDAIKELGKYELRKYELDRQKKILSNKKDEQSKKRLKQLNKFNTTKDYDYTHILVSDYGIRLLQVAPLLPYYDIDPNIVQFIGTGAWDDEAFFYEPSLQNAIFPGVEEKKRKNLIDDYSQIYKDKLLRVSTLPYDLIGLLSYVFEKNLSIYELYSLLNNSEVRFEGVDGSFYFKKNAIQRDLNILKISNGKAIKVN